MKKRIAATALIIISCSFFISVISPNVSVAAVSIQQRASIIAQIQSLLQEVNRLRALIVQLKSRESQQAQDSNTFAAFTLTAPTSTTYRMGDTLTAQWTGSSARATEVRLRLETIEPSGNYVDVDDGYIARTNLGSGRIDFNLPSDDSNCAIIAGARLHHCATSITHAIQFNGNRFRIHAELYDADPPYTYRGDALGDIFTILPVGAAYPTPSCNVTAFTQDSGSTLVTWNASSSDSATWFAGPDSGQSVDLSGSKIYGQLPIGTSLNLGVRNRGGSANCRTVVSQTPEVQALGIYTSNHSLKNICGSQWGEVNVNITMSGAVVLALSAHEPTVWRIRNTGNATIAKVISTGFFPQIITGDVSAVAVESHAHYQLGFAQQQPTNQFPNVFFNSAITQPGGELYYAQTSDQSSNGLCNEAASIATNQRTYLVPVQNNLQNAADDFVEGYDKNQSTFSNFISHISSWAGANHGVRFQGYVEQSSFIVDGKQGTLVGLQSRNSYASGFESQIANVLTGLEALLQSLWIH